MDLTTITQVIGQLGFPIFVAVYVMVRMEKILAEIKETMDKNNTLLEKIFDYFIEGRDKNNEK